MTFALEKFPGLLIDFDGTLVNTEKLHQLALKTFFEQKGINFEKKEPGKSTFHIFRDWGEATGDPQLARRYLRQYLLFLVPFFARHLDEVDWYPDALEFISATKDFPRVLVTGSLRIWLRVLDRKLWIFEKFPQIVTKEEVLPDREKPDPYAYLIAAQKLGVPPESCLAIEDSFSGIVAAKKAGCFVVAVEREGRKGFERADKIVNTLSALLLS